MRLFLWILVVSTLYVRCERQPDVVKPYEIKGPASVEGAIIAGEYIVQFDENYIAPAIAYIGDTKGKTRNERAALFKKQGLVVEKEIDQWLSDQHIRQEQVLSRYTAIVAGVALKNVDSLTYERIKASEAVKTIEFNRKVSLPKGEIEALELSGGVSDRSQETPCAILNAGGSVAGNQNRYIWILDTGIDLDHPDLNVKLDYCTGFVDDYVGEDYNGHGTLVAGVAAAKNNAYGIVGVSAGAPVIAVKVLNSAGAGSDVDIFNGLQYVATLMDAGDVVNLSLESFFGPYCSSSSGYAPYLQALHNGKVWVSIAAGNHSANAALYAPGCVQGISRVVTVASMTCSRAFSTDFSNWGIPPVDWIATGKNVKSTYLNGGYTVASGTSLSAPVVAGIMHIRNALPVSGGTVNYNGVSYKIAKRIQ